MWLAARCQDSNTMKKKCETGGGRVFSIFISLQKLRILSMYYKHYTVVITLSLNARIPSLIKFHSPVLFIVLLTFFPCNFLGAV